MATSRYLPLFDSIIRIGYLVMSSQKVSSKTYHTKCWNLKPNLVLNCTQRKFRYGAMTFTQMTLNRMTLRGTWSSVCVMISIDVFSIMSVSFYQYEIEKNILMLHFLTVTSRYLPFWDIIISIGYLVMSCRKVSSKNPRYKILKS
jgi:hypothetical protein